MISTHKRAGYKAFGLDIVSELFLPELTVSNNTAALEPIEIVKGDLTLTWEGYATNNKYTIVDMQRNLFMLNIPGTAIFAVENGKRIIVSPATGVDEGEVRLYLLGTCMGALLLQRKVLPLHGSAVAIDGQAYLFLGDSGAGKSTLASALISKGAAFLSDDVIAVTCTDPKNAPLIMPAYPQQKLWQESLHGFGMDESHYQPLFERETKFAIPIQEHYINEPLSLAGIFELRKSEDSSLISQPIDRLACLDVLYRHTYRNFLLHRMDLLTWHFSQTAHIAGKVSSSLIQRPSTWFSAHEVAELVWKNVQKEGVL